MTECGICVQANTLKELSKGFVSYLGKHFKMIILLSLLVGTITTSVIVNKKPFESSPIQQHIISHKK